MVQLGQEALVEDTAADPAWASFRDVALHHDLAACAAVPIFGSARRDLKIIEIPVRYGARTYGETNISRFRDFWLLLAMSWRAFLKIKLR